MKSDIFIEEEWGLATGDFVHRSNPESGLGGNVTGTWIVGPFFRSYTEAANTLKLLKEILAERKNE